VRLGRKALRAGIARLPEDLQMALARRSTLHLTSIPVTLSRGDEPDVVVAFHDGIPLLGARLGDRDPGPEATEGTVDVYFEAVTKIQVVSLSVAGRVVWQLVRGNVHPDVEAQLEETVVERARVIAGAREATDRFEAMLADQGWDEARRSVLTPVVEHRNKAFEELALPWLPDEAFEPFVEATTRHGVHDLVDPPLLPSLAILTLLDGLGAYLEEVNFPGSVVDLSTDCLAILDTFKERFGAIPFVLQGTTDEDGTDKTRIRSFL
jgi:hypothetical protein